MFNKNRKYSLCYSLQVPALLILLTSNSLVAQRSLLNFTGNFTFKESFYYYPISRQLYDTAIIYSYYDVNKMVEIQQSAMLSPGESHDEDFVPIRFCRNADSIFYKYSEPYDKNHDTVCVKLFPLNYKDTAEVTFCYRLKMDTVRGTDKNRTLSIHTECYGDDDEIKTWRIKDTVLHFNDYRIECYSFMQREALRYYKDTYFTRIILVDKATLIPMDVKEYNFHTAHRPRFRNIYQGKNLLTYHRKLIGID